MLPELNAAAVRELIGRNDARILEIGANDGTDTLAFLQTFPQGRVDCFECDPRAIATWRKRIPANHPRATLYETALGDAVGTMPFHQSGGKPPGAEWEGVESWDKSGSLLAPDRHVEFSPWLTFPSVVEVPVTTLDIWHTTQGRVCDQSGHFDLLWCDVQGAEAMVLRGAKAILPLIQWVYCEVHERPYYKGQATVKEVAALLPGFVIHSRHAGDNILFRRRGT